MSDFELFKMKVNECIKSWRECMSVCLKGKEDDQAWMKIKNKMLEIDKISKKQVWRGVERNRVT